MGSWGDKDTSNIGLFPSSIVGLWEDSLHGELGGHGYIKHRLVSKLYCRVWEGSLHRSLGNMNISKVLHVLSYRVNCTG